jgi:hypothetical protein
MNFDTSKRIHRNNKERDDKKMKKCFKTRLCTLTLASAMLMVTLCLPLAASASENKLLFGESFEGYAAEDVLFASGAITHAGGAVLSANEGYATGDRAIKIGEKPANNKAVLFDLSGTQAMTLNLGQTIDFTGAAGDDFVFELDLIRGGSAAPRMTISFQDESGTPVFAVLGNNDLTIGLAYSKTGAVQNFSTTHYSTSVLRNLKFVFKKSENTVEFYGYNGLASNTLQRSGDKISKVVIMRHHISSSPSLFWVDNIKAYLQPLTGVPEFNVDFEDTATIGFANPADEGDTNLYLFDIPAREYKYGNVTVRNGKTSDNQGVCGYAGPTMISADPLNGDNRCMAIDGTAGGIVRFLFAETYVLSADTGEDLILEYDFYAPSVSNTSVSVHEGSNTVFALGNYSTDTWFYQSNITDAGMKYDENPQGLAGNFRNTYPGWATYKMVIKSGSMKADLYINDKLVIMNVEARENVLADGQLAISSLRFSGREKSGSGLSYIDNVKVYTSPADSGGSTMRISNPYIYVNDNISQAAVFGGEGYTYTACLNIEIPDAAALSPKNCYIITAHYSENGDMKGIVTKGVTVTGPAPVHIANNVYEPAEGTAQAGDYVKVMLWNGVDEMVPLLKEPLVLGSTAD